MPQMPNGLIILNFGIQGDAGDVITHTKFYKISSGMLSSDTIPKSAPLNRVG